MGAISTATLDELALRRFTDSMEVPTRFFEANADLVSRACLEMAKRFHRGGRLLVFGNGSAATDAQHVSVEFVHPVIVGKRALPAIALTNDIGTVTGVSQAEGVDMVYAYALRSLARPQDIAMGISPDGNCGAVVLGLEAAREPGLVTIGLASGDGGRMGRVRGLDFLFLVPSQDPMVIQEVHETLYHVLWELVHVFFEHKGLLV